MRTYLRALAVALPLVAVLTPTASADETSYQLRKINTTAVRELVSTAPGLARGFTDHAVIADYSWRDTDRINGPRDGGAHMQDADEVSVWGGGAIVIYLAKQFRGTDGVVRNWPAPLPTQIGQYLEWSFASTAVPAKLTNPNGHLTVPRSVGVQGAAAGSGAKRHRALVTTTTTTQVFRIEDGVLALSVRPRAGDCTVLDGDRTGVSSLRGRWVVQCSRRFGRDSFDYVWPEGRATGGLKWAAVRTLIHLPYAQRRIALGGAVRSDCTC